MTEDLLVLGIEELGLNLSDANIADLELFLQEMTRWNQVHNLTAIEDEKDSIHLHLIDSIAVLPVLRKFLTAQNPKIADLGSGGGLPAIPIAIAIMERVKPILFTLLRRAKTAMSRLIFELMF